MQFMITSISRSVVIYDNNNKKKNYSTQPQFKTLVVTNTWR